MRWHGYAATLLALAPAAFIVQDPVPTFDGRHLLMIAAAVWLVWSLCQPAAPRRRATPSRRHEATERRAA